MTISKDILAKNPCLDEWAILHAYRGSIAHGMYIPNSDPNSIDDKDTMAVCVPPKAYYFGYPPGYGSNEMFPVNGTKEIKEGKWDIVAYEARKFIGLLAQGNPNVLCMLWVDKQYVLKETAEGRLLRGERGIFVGKHVYHSFTGYAYGQLHRMTHFVGRGYMGEKRRGLVEKYGYDTKNAAHLIRLLRRIDIPVGQHRARDFRHGARDGVDDERQPEQHQPGSHERTSLLRGVELGGIVGNLGGKRLATIED